VQAVDGWIKRGVPHLERGGRGRAWKFDPEAVERWIAARKAGRSEHVLRTEQIRLTRARADRAEIDLSKLRGEILDAADVTAAIAHEYARLREELLQIPGRHAPALHACATTEALEELLADAIRAALAALSGNGIRHGKK
jgi:phage terminase Nu1 subunit (DNA packaging protein)